MKNIIEEIKKICPRDLYEVGFASLSGLLKSEYSKYKYGISLARKLDDSIIDNIANGPTDSYYNYYHEINNELNKKTEEISMLLNAGNIEVLPVNATTDESKRDENYLKTLCYFHSHKMTAARAGIGWIGKTDLLITSRFGPRVRLASILMTKKIGNVGSPINESQCGNCNICIDNCPAHAATGKLWKAGVERNEFYDPFKCREFCRMISKEKINKEISLCGICISVCPKGKI